MPTFKEYRDGIKDLSPIERHHLRKVLDLYQNKLEPTPDTTGDTKSSFIETILFETIQRYVQPIPLTILHQKDPFKLNTKLKQIISEIEQLAQSLELDQAGLAKLCSVVIESANDTLVERGIPKSFRALLYVISSVVILLDNAYPGYLSSGTFKPLILDRHD